MNKRQIKDCGFSEYPHEIGIGRNGYRCQNCGKGGTFTEMLAHVVAQQPVVQNK